MSPYQHGEFFVTDDGAETDLDLGQHADDENRAWPPAGQVYPRSSLKSGGATTSAARSRSIAHHR